MGFFKNTFTKSVSITTAEGVATTATKANWAAIGAVSAVAGSLGLGAFNLYKHRKAMKELVALETARKAAEEENENELVEVLSGLQRAVADHKEDLRKERKFNHSLAARVTYLEAEMEASRKKDAEKAAKAAPQTQTLQVETPGESEETPDAKAA